MRNYLQIFSALLLIMLFLPFPGFSQNLEVDSNEKKIVKVRPFRIGVKVGFPNLIGGNLEYVTPLLGKKLSVSADYSTLESDWFLSAEDMGEDSNQDELNYTYLDLGLNYYLFKPGKGLYAGIGYNNIKAEATLEKSESIEYIDEKHSSFNIKLGAKLGGLFYFRPEIGYAFDPLPKKYDVLTINNDGTRETRTDDWSEARGQADILFKGLMANIGIGFAF